MSTDERVEKAVNLSEWPDPLSKLLNKFS